MPGGSLPFVLSRTEQMNTAQGQLRLPGGANGKRNFHSPPEQLEISYIYPKNQHLSIAPQFLFQLWSLFLSGTIPSLRNQVIYLQ